MAHLGFFLCVLASLVSSLLAQKCHVSVSGIILVDHVLSSFRDENIHECYVKCKEKIGCMSINFYRDGLMCELNNRTVTAKPSKKRDNLMGVYFEKPKPDAIGSDEQLPGESCMEIKTWNRTYSPSSGVYWIKHAHQSKQIYCNMSTGDADPCGSSPCKNQGTCQKLDKVAYSCTCVAPFIGKNCERVNFKGSFAASGSGRNGAIQSLYVGVSGLYLIRAGGARGGTHSYNYGYLPGTYYGGKGATMEGKFQIEAGTSFNVVVGQRGGNSVEVYGGESTTLTAAQLGKSIYNSAGTGGGGGSFVYTSDNKLLVAAGGGGGPSSGYHGVDGQAGTSGTASIGTTPSQVRGGGTNGNAGNCNSAGGNYHGGVGAGWHAQGCVRLGVQHGERGGSRVQGWVGGQTGTMNRGLNGGPAPGAVGGFGGGGGGSQASGASGGGGGYSGGGSGTYAPQAGGGGGSYCGGSSCKGISGGNPNDDGFVKIYFLSV